MPLYWVFTISSLFCLFAFPPQASAPKPIPPAQAKAHAGETLKVCGLVAGVFEPQSRSRRQPFFLNFEQPYPQTEFSAVIWRQDRAAFGDLRALEGQRVCVTGKVYLYRERAQMKLTAATNLQRE